MSVKSLVPVNLLAATDNPVRPHLRAGDAYFNTATNTLRIFNGSSWLEFFSGSGQFTTLDGGYYNSTFSPTPIDGGLYSTVSFSGSYNGGGVV